MLAPSALNRLSKPIESCKASHKSSNLRVKRVEVAITMRSETRKMPSVTGKDEKIADENMLRTCFHKKIPGAIWLPAPCTSLPCERHKGACNRPDFPVFPHMHIY